MIPESRFLNAFLGGDPTSLEPKERSKLYSSRSGAYPGGYINQLKASLFRQETNSEQLINNYVSRATIPLENYFTEFLEEFNTFSSEASVDDTIDMYYEHLENNADNPETIKKLTILKNIKECIESVENDVLEILLEQCKYHLRCHFSQILCDLCFTKIKVKYLILSGLKTPNNKFMFIVHLHEAEENYTDFDDISMYKFARKKKARIEKEKEYKKERA